MRFRAFLIAMTLSVSLSSFAQDGFTRPPIATNSISSIQFRDLYLHEGDYTIMQTVTESALVSASYSKKGKDYEIICEDEDFRLKYEWDKDKERYVLEDWSGVVKLGYLRNDMEVKPPKDADDIARRLAIYRLIATASQNGADAIIDPIVTMNMARSGNLFYYKVTATGRMIKLNQR